jgi:flagellar hook assembly protein FlgD
LDIYDVQGRVVTTLVREHKQAGYYSVTWDGTDGLGGRAASGIYFCRVQIDGQLAAMAKLMKL